MATFDRRLRLLLVAVAVAAVVGAVIMAGRGRSGGRAVRPEATAADPWAAGGSGTEVVGARHLPGAGGFLKMRQAGPPVTVTGVVRMDPGGTPVAGAEVAFMNESGENTAIADASGRYSIEVASGIRWKVHARSEKAVGYPETFVPSAPTQALAAATRDLTVHATSTVRGKVVDERGGVVPGAVVSIEVEAGVKPLLETALPLSTTADDAGRFELPALPGPVIVKGAVGMIQGVALLAALAPGDTAEVVVVVHEPIVASGRVVDAEGQAVAGAKVLAATTITPGGPTEKKSIDSGADGAFEVTMPAGWLRLEARHGAEQSAARAEWVNGGKRLDGVELVVVQPVGLRGRVVTTDGTPVESAKVRLSANAVYDGTTRSDGTFEIAAIPGQAYTVKIKHSDGGVVRQVAAWNAEETFVMRRFGGLRVKATGATGEVTVTVDSFLPEGETAARPPAEGRFRGDAAVELPGLEPGLYDLTVAAKGAGAVKLPRVAVAEGATREVTAALVAPATVRGVVRSNGQLIPGALVTIAGATAFTDSRGRWSIGDVAAGPIAVAVSKQDFGTTWVSATAGKDAPPVEIELRYNGTGLVDGIGVVLGPSPRGAIIASVLPGSPAEGKLAAGDLIEAVDGTDVAAAPVDDIVARLRGSAGSSVSITVHRGDDSSQVDVVRRRLVVPEGTPAVAIAARGAAGGRRC